MSIKAWARGVGLVVVCSGVAWGAEPELVGEAPAEAAPAEAAPAEAAPAEAAPAELPEEAPEVVAPEVVDPEVAWETMAPEQVFQEAVIRRRTGDLQGSLARFVWLDEQGGLDHAGRIQWGVSFEYLERFGEALAQYEAVLADGPTPPLRIDAAYRRALVLEDLGRSADSLAQVKELKAMGSWTPVEVQALALVQGINELESGKDRKGVKRIERALAILEGSDELPWLRAKGRAALAAYLFSEAAEVELTGDKKAARRLQERTMLLKAGELQVTALAEMGEPEFILEGLLGLGDAYLSLHDDLLAAPPPRKLDAEQVEMYREALSLKAAALPPKAREVYEIGVLVAVRFDWQGAVAGELRARRDALDRG